MGSSHAYDFDEFKKFCLSKEVQVLDGVMKKAEDFNIRTSKELLAFIANDGLEKLTFFNSATLKNKPRNYEGEIYVDAYHFNLGGMRGYIAFYKSPITKKWVIKSFHICDNSNRPFIEAFNKVDFKKLGD